MTEVVSARNVSKRFGPFEALRGVDFTVSEGSIVGLIGPNGAGKTTTLKALLGLCPFEGEIEVLGTDPRSGRHEIMRRVSFISDVGVLPRWMKVSQAVDYVQGVHPGFNRDRALNLLEETNIHLKKRIGQLSKGMVTQLHLALVLAIDVDLLVLDEPTIGLDILYRKSFYDRLLSDFFDHSRSIIVSTHQVEEIASLLSHLLFINEGRIVLDCSMEEVGKRYVQLLVSPGSEQQAAEFNPIYTREFLGKQGMLFEFDEIPRSELEALGELSTPSVSDLFVAKMGGGRS